MITTINCCKKSKIRAGYAAKKETAGTDEHYIQRKDDSEDDKKRRNMVLRWRIISASDDRAYSSPE